MSDPRIAAIVCEGQTDVPILRAALQTVWPGLEEVRCLQPELDETDRAKGAAGWSLVKTWCRTHAGRLNDILDPDLGERIDLLVIAVDLDIAIEAGIADLPVEVGQYEAKRLHTTLASWLETTPRRKVPDAIIFATPVMAIESWIIAALFPREDAPEQIRDPAEWLVQRGKLRNSTIDKKPWKELHRYRSFAIAVANKLPRVRRVCKEADRVMHLVEQRRVKLDNTGSPHHVRNRSPRS